MTAVFVAVLLLGFHASSQPTRGAEPSGYFNPAAERILVSGEIHASSSSKWSWRAGTAYEEVERGTTFDGTVKPQALSAPSSSLSEIPFDLDGDSAHLSYRREEGDSDPGPERAAYACTTSESGSPPMGSGFQLLVSSSAFTGAARLPLFSVRHDSWFLPTTEYCETEVGPHVSTGGVAFELDAGMALGSSGSYYEIWGYPDPSLPPVWTHTPDPIILLACGGSSCDYRVSGRLSTSREGTEDDFGTVSTYERVAHLSYDFVVRVGKEAGTPVEPVDDTPEKPEPCRNRYLAGEWYGSSGLDMLGAMTEPDASYGLAVKWCKAPERPVQIKHTDIRLAEDLGSGGSFNALTKTIQDQAFGIKHRWVEDGPSKPEIFRRRGGGAQITAQTGHFDVCALPTGGVGKVLGKLGVKALGLLPRKVRKKVLGKVLKKPMVSAVRGFLRLQSRRQEKLLARLLVGSRHPDQPPGIHPVPRVYTRDEAAAEAKKRAKDYVERNEKAFERLIEKLVEEAVGMKFDGVCLMAWEPKVVVSISGAGRGGVYEAGKTGHFWWVSGESLTQPGD